MAKGQIKQKQATINQSVFENLCAIQCTREEICSVLGVSEKTLNSWCKRVYSKNFSLVFAEKRKNGCASLRRTQWKLAEKNTAMAIWLGKQYLGQKDNVEYNDDGIKNINENLVNIAELINKPLKDRTEEDV